MCTYCSVFSMVWTTRTSAGSKSIDYKYLHLSTQAFCVWFGRDTYIKHLNIYNDDTQHLPWSLWNNFIVKYLWFQLGQQLTKQHLWCSPSLCACCAGSLGGRQFTCLGMEQTFLCPLLPYDFATDTQPQSFKNDTVTDSEMCYHHKATPQPLFSNGCFELFKSANLCYWVSN